MVGVDYKEKPMAKEECGQDATMYNTVCKDRFNEAAKRDEAIFQKLEDLGDKISHEVGAVRKLLLGNGEPGFSGRINDLERDTNTLKSRWKWIMGAGGTIFVVTVGRLVYDLLTKVKI